jgi:hypothetical protein
MDKDILNEKTVTKNIKLQFCKGLIGTEFFLIEQISK